jgi:hypothetical protein
MIIFLYRLKKSSQLFIPDSLLVGKRETLGTIDEMVEGTRD